MDNIEIIKKLVKNGWELENMDENIKTNKDFVKIALENNGLVYQILNDELKNDQELVEIAVKSGKYPVLKYLPEKFQNNVHLMEIALSNYCGP